MDGRPSSFDALAARRRDAIDAASSSSARAGAAAPSAGEDDAATARTSTLGDVLRLPRASDDADARVVERAFGGASRRQREEMSARARARAPMRFRVGTTMGRADATFECARADAWECATVARDGDGRMDDGYDGWIKGDGIGSRVGRALWARRADANAFAAALCLQVAFPETMTKVNRFGAALGLVRMTLKNTEQAPSLGPLDAPVVARATRVALATRALTTSARMLCPTLHAHATAASALMSVKVLFKQPPLRAGIARAIKGTKGEMSEAERIALWHTRYRWAALRLVKHIPSDPVRAIDTAPLMGLMAFVQGVSMRVGSMNLSEGGPNGSFSMSFPASWNQAKRAKRKSAFGSKRAIAAEAKIHPIDILNIAQISMRGARGQRRIEAPEREADALEHSPPAAEEGAGSSSDVYTGGDVSEDRNVDIVDDDANIWQDRQLATASWATQGFSIALLIRATYLFVTWLPVLTFAVPLLLLSQGAPGPLSASMRKRAWATMHSAIALCGAAFIKWAQWASTREDVFPKDLCHQLEQLHDDAPQHSYGQTLRILANEFGFDPRLVFAQFPRKPMASGSVAQVYKARLRKEVAAVCSALAQPRKLDLNEDGTMDVAVKVRHPNVAKRIFLDFQILRAIAGIADALPALKGMQLKNTLGQFSHTMTAQTDLRNEADHLLKFTHNMKSEVQIRAPRPVPGFVTEAVLVETFVKGDGLGSAIKHKTSRNSELCSLGVHAYLLMLLRDNFIHQDLHPGNILYSVENGQSSVDSETAGIVKLELIDFGIADELPKAVRNKFLGFLCFLLRGEGEKAADVALTWDAKQTCTDRVALRRDMARLVSSQGDVYTQRVDLDGLLKEIMQLFRKHGVSIDGIYASLVVSLCVLVGFATSLDPEINLFEVAAPSVMAFALTGDVVGRLFKG